ncbi:MAG TPA: hypothetical protein IGS52_09835 [Oscillatoriaceae cyanobacterium M33_DOE_052]|uniref:Uncharacterized protein n=1 Tax=Planktothricoides sp. SpSt-374 TaxID=2282167 RepID=A0A7C3ZKA9_9CYAN|nr:hypothetical protein [Oscillatoriaceae cyanobacterium M33_DOE_052]
MTKIFVILSIQRTTDARTTVAIFACLFSYRRRRRHQTSPEFAPEVAPKHHPLACRRSLWGISLG